jgi:hypothetical protein
MADTDRDLLERAAKAAGVFLTPQTMAEVFPGFEWCESDTPVFDDGVLIGTVAWFGDDGKPAGTEKREWNPLTDDGDALRLAVKLRLDLDHNAPQDQHLYVCASRCGCEMMYAPVSEVEELDDEGQRQAATRRAIVRAAASMAERPAQGAE